VTSTGNAAGGKLSRWSVSDGRGDPAEEGDQQRIAKGDDMMTSIGRGEDNTWIEFQIVRCDFCDGEVDEVDGEADEIAEPGWSEGVDGLHVCATCRARMTAGP
jgi:hypothetical protein